MSKNKVLKVIGKKGRPLKMTVTARKEAAWNIFSEWIRRREGHSSICYTCGVIKLWNDGMQAGHGIGGRNNAVLFMEEVVKPQCERCNGYLRGNYKVFTLKLIKELGAERYEELLIESNKVLKLSPLQFLDIQEKYKKKLEELT